MFNPAPGIFGRKAIQSTMIGDVPINQGASVSYLIYPLLHDPKYFSDPHEFRPERWENSTVDQ